VLYSKSLKKTKHPETKAESMAVIIQNGDIAKMRLFPYKAPKHSHRHVANWPVLNPTSPFIQPNR